MVQNNTGRSLIHVVFKAQKLLHVTKWDCTLWG